MRKDQLKKLYDKYIAKGWIAIIEIQDEFNLKREAVKDLDYYSRMRLMKDDFINARPPSIWEPWVQDFYIENLKYIISEWENTQNIEFLKVRIKFGGKRDVYNVRQMIENGWITEEFINRIIEDIKQKLDERGLL